jgi:hypothetical protein
MNLDCYVLAGLWCLFAIAFGIYDGFLWHYWEWNKPFPQMHPHKVATFMRTVTAATVVVSCDTHRWVLAAFCVLSFSFLHNGMYYQQRNWLGYKRYNFFSQSDSSTGFAIRIGQRYWRPLEFPFWQRLVMFIASIIIIFVYA